ncbi:MAG: hypothetical protein LKE86_01435 [Eubacterium sp.]|jgi:hypothetical protein|nr:hypothetical protein [Eubacterium sp.]MCH4046111.1 hypothetical protein [Eubacterium sp.]MCH4079206.1 hypothetical protein [Eubacterium sp.]MCH4110430.1 hypothetical protein [Eubacterium sp.]MCI1428447.1 hypothetical protein [Eubacterium sp.]
MEINKKTMELICRLESIIGEQCSNDDSYNGWTNEYGCDYRYPVTYNISDTDSSKSRGIAPISNPQYIRTLRYRFGANKLYIGNGIIQVLEYLEDRYGIDFSELENNKDE